MKTADATNFEARILTGVSSWAEPYFYIGKSLQTLVCDDFHDLGLLKNSLIKYILCKFKPHDHENFFKKDYLGSITLRSHSK